MFAMISMSVIITNSVTLLPLASGAVALGKLMSRRRIALSDPTPPCLTDRLLAGRLLFLDSAFRRVQEQQTVCVFFFINLGSMLLCMLGVGMERTHFSSFVLSRIAMRAWSWRRVLRMRSFSNALVTQALVCLSDIYRGAIMVR